MKFKTTLTVEVTIERVIDVLDEELEGFEWETAEPDAIADYLQQLDDQTGGEYLREFPNIDLANGVGEVATATFTHAEPVRKRLEVTVAVELADVRDVLTWMRGQSIANEENHRWLTAYSETEGAQRDAIVAHMPASLGWCVSEFERDGSDALDSVLRSAARKSRDSTS